MTLPVLPFCMGYPEEICWTWFDILIYASTTQKIICSFELSLFSCLLSFVYQLIVQGYACVRLSMPITLVVRQAIPSRNDLEKQTPVPHPYLGLGQSSCIPQIKCQSSFWFCSTLEYYPLYVRIVMRTAPTLMNFDVVILLTIISHSSALVLMQPEYRQMNCDVWNQYA